MDIPGITIQIPQVNQAVKPQDTAKSFQDVLQQTSSPAGMDNTISTQKTAEVKQDLPVEKTRDTQLTKVLSSVVSGQGKMDKIIKLATSGRTFNPTELLAIQAGVYKFSQELELTSKVVEKATDGVKQTLQTQV
jgi:hypothetical protein